MPVLVPAGAPPLNWTLTTVTGSYASYVITIADQLGDPWDTDGTTWSYVANISAGYSGPPVLSVTTTPTSAGMLTVTSTGVVELVLYPAATAALKAGDYRHTLWMDPGEQSAFAWATGTLAVESSPQP